MKANTNESPAATDVAKDEAAKRKAAKKAAKKRAARQRKRAQNAAVAAGQTPPDSPSTTEESEAYNTDTDAMTLNSHDDADTVKGEDDSYQADTFPSDEKSEHNVDNAHPTSTETEESQSKTEAATTTPAEMTQENHTNGLHEEVKPVDATAPTAAGDVADKVRAVLYLCVRLCV